MLKNIGGSVEREAKILKGTQFLWIPPWDFCLSSEVYKKNKRQMHASFFYTNNINWFAVQEEVRKLYMSAVACLVVINRSGGGGGGIRVFKIQERGRLEERHGRRGPGSNIRCSRSSAAGKLS